MADQAGVAGPKAAHMAASVHVAASPARPGQRYHNRSFEKPSNFHGQQPRSPPVEYPSCSSQVTYVAAESVDDDLEAQRQREVFHHRQQQLRKLERHRPRPSSAATIRSSGSAFIAKLARPSSRRAVPSQSDYSHDISDYNTGLARQISSQGSDTFSNSSRGYAQTRHGKSSRSTESEARRASGSKSVASTSRTKLQMEGTESASDEHLEAAQDVLIWIPEPSAPGSAPRTPLPQRDPSLSHAQLGRSPPSTSAGTDAGSSAKRAGLTPCWRKDKQTESSKKMYATPMMMGSWGRGAVSLKENGQFYIFGETRALLHPMLATRLKVTDIRPVDPSLLQRYNVLGIFARPLAIAGKAADCSRVDVRGSSASTVGQAAAANDDPIVYISFPSAHKLQYWTSLLRAYAIPELHDSQHASSAKRAYRRHRSIHVRCLDYRPGMPIAPHVGSSSSKEESIWSQDEEEAPVSPSTASSVAEPGFSSDDEQEGEGPADDGAGSNASVGRRGTAEAGRQESDTSLSLGGSTISDGRTPAAPCSGRRVSSAGTMRRSISVPGQSSSRADHLPANLSRSTLLSSLGGRRDQTHAALMTPYDKVTAAGSLKATFPLACFVYLDGNLCARTTMQPWTTTSPHYHWMEEFEFKDLPDAECLQVDVYQDVSSSASSGHKTPNRASSSSHPHGSPLLSVPPATAKVRYSLLGSAEIPLSTFTRGEEVSGWFPLWAHRSSASERTCPSSASLRHALPTPYEAYCVGELWLKIKFCEEVVMKRAKYLQVEQALSSPRSFEQLLSSLASHLSDTELSSHLVDVYAASMTLVPRLVQLGQHHDFGAHSPDLLLRSGNVMSRLVVTIALRYGHDWLRECLYPTLQQVCEEGQSIDVDALNWFDTSGVSPAPQSDRVAANRQPGSASSSHHLFVYVNNTSPYALAAVDDGRIQDGKLALEGKAALDLLRVLLNRLWKNIYESRHRCPTELRQVLASIRRTVYDQFILTSSPSVAIAAGLQSLGSLVFLRFFCPAIAAPNEYGLMLHAPDARAKKTLATLSKVLLKLHNKMAGSDQQRMGGWMKELSAFWKEEASAYDDFVTAISTSPDAPPTSSRTSGKSHDTPAPMFGQLDEQDQIVHTMISRRMKLLPYTLHREMLAADPPGLRMGDQALPFAKMVSLIVNTIDAGAPAKQQDEKTGEARAGNNLQRTEVGDSEAVQDGTGTQSRQLLPPGSADTDSVNAGQPDEQQVLQNFVYLCQSVAEKASSLVDQAGCFPSPVNTAALASPRSKSSAKLAEAAQGPPHVSSATSPSASQVSLSGSCPRSSGSPTTIHPDVSMSPLEQLPSRTETLRPKDYSEVQELPTSFTRNVSIDEGNVGSPDEDSARPRPSDSIKSPAAPKPKSLRRINPSQALKTTSKTQVSQNAERGVPSRVERRSLPANGQPVSEKTQASIPVVLGSKTPAYVLHAVETVVQGAAGNARPAGPMPRRSTTSVHTSSTPSNGSGEEASEKRGSKWWKRG